MSAGRHLTVFELCVGPWPDSPRKDLNYDLDVLGGGYDPHNVLTCICGRCGKRWSYDSPSGECQACERETLIEYLADQDCFHRGVPPRYRKPPSIPPYDVVMADSFVGSYASMTEQDAPAARADLREIGLHLARVRPAPEDLERAEMRRYMAEYFEVALDKLTVEKQAAWRAWWDTREEGSQEDARLRTRRTGHVGGRAMSEDGA